MTIEDDGFVSSIERMKDDAIRRKELVSRGLATGIPYLDAVWRKILPTDFCLIGAATGAGKTELITQIARKNAMLGKRVYVFALEAEKNEIERRIIFQELAQLYRESGGEVKLNFRDYVFGDYDDLLQPFQKQASERLMGLENLFTFYRDSDFGISDYERKYSLIYRRADLIICDHLHYFDLESDDENKELSQILKRKRDLSLISGVPQILVAHLRKKSNAYKLLVPELEDFQGTSNITKIPTKVAIIASGGPSDRDPNIFITYFRTGKFRLFGAPASYIGYTGFDIRTNTYLKEYAIGKLSQDGQNFITLNANETPSWLWSER